jgi:hypothetical protein
LTVQPRVVFPNLRFAPDLSSIGVPPQRVMMADRFLLEDAQYEAFLVPQSVEIGSKGVARFGDRADSDGGT